MPDEDGGYMTVLSQQRAARAAKTHAAGERRAALLGKLLVELRRRGHRATAKPFSEDHTDVKIDLVEVRIESTTTKAGRLLISVGGYSRHRSARRFPEPKAGFDVPRIANAVIDWRTWAANRQAEDRRLEAEQGMADAALTNILRGPLAGFDVHFERGSYHVQLRPTNAPQVAAILKAAVAAGVEP